MPKIVSTLRSLCRKALRRMNLMISSGFSLCVGATAVVALGRHGALPLRQLAFLQMADGARSLGGARVVCHHEDRFLQLPV
jgi:hypothetical protein